MRRFLTFTCCLFALGCADDPTEPVDAVFRVTIEPLENTCDGNVPPEDVTVLVDVFRRTDGTVDIGKEVFWIPGPDRYEGVPIDGNEVDFAETRTSPYSGLTRESRIRGTLTPEAIDVTVSSESDRGIGGAYETCVRRVRLRGAPRPFGDPDVYDGAYVVKLASYGYVCPGDPEPSAAEWTWRFVLDMNPITAERTIFSLDDQLNFSPTMPGPDGRMSWSGDMFLISEANFVELQGSAEGTCKPGDVDLDIRYRELADPSGCEYRYRMRGAKRIPSSAALDNEYRAVYDVRYGCIGASETFEAPVELITQADGQIEIKDAFGRNVMALSDGAISSSFGAEEEGLILTYSGRADPPHLSYTAEYRLLGPAGWCSISYDVAGVVRYVSESDAQE